MYKSVKPIDFLANAPDNNSTPPIKKTLKTVPSVGFGVVVTKIIPPEILNPMPNISNIKRYPCNFQSVDMKFII